jgi:hypothetical protein
LNTPLGKAIVEGVEIPGVRGVMGYGPAKYVTPSEVREIAAALDGFPAEERVNAFSLKEANQADVYGSDLAEHELADDEKEALVQYLQLLRDFYRDAAGNGNGVIHWVE